jgi:putative restriction endonuclease
MMFEVSRRIRDDFENDRAYYALHGQALKLPRQRELRPAVANVSWHNESRYMG